MATQDRMEPPSGPVVVLGRVGKPYGVRGWNHVRSDTDPPESIAAFSRWMLDEDAGWTHRPRATEQWQGSGLVVRFEGVTSREEAARLSGRRIAVVRDELPVLDDDQYYWADLIGCGVATVDGIELGELTAFIETGAHDVMVISGARERLIPFVNDVVVKSVSVQARTILVDWDPDD
jgi:16S rRNA processing protein RimM